jgi:CheY-like chemotaxis protein
MVAKTSIRTCHVVAYCLASLSVFASPLIAQEHSDDMVGQNVQAWKAWSAAIKALEGEDLTQAGRLLTEMAEQDLSDLRLALMGDRTGTLRLEQWAEKPDAPASVKPFVEKIRNGRRQRSLAEDGWHFAAIGRFKFADASFQALDESNPDPVALLELARQNPNRHSILIKLINNTEVGPSAQQFLKLLNRGEASLRTDAYEIVANIHKLGGSPRMVYNATNRLKDSGEYAIPHLIQALQDSSRNELHPAIIQVISKIGRAALNPLCMALGMGDEVTKLIVMKSLEEIGYKQAVPYLARLAEDTAQSAEVRTAAARALGALGASNHEDVSQAFYRLADGYYNNVDSLRADPRSDLANVWYLRGEELRFVPVPQVIFNDVMAMRSCEAALFANSDRQEATALWIAANFRREAKLGLDVESDQADPLAAKDSTRPEQYPRAIYFARAAGPKYNHMVLARAFRDRDPGVALGAIAALGATAGEPSLVGSEDFKQALVQTLAFPNRQVRVKAALALGRALPKTSFADAQNVIPVLAEALLQSDRQAALIVDPDSESANKFQAQLRSSGYVCAIGASLFEALQRGKEANLSAFDVVLLASDVQQPGITDAVTQLRDNFETAATPIVILAKEDQVVRASRLARDAVGVEVLLAGVIDLGDPARIAEQVAAKVARASQALGMSPLDTILSLQLALEASHVLRGIAETGSKVFDFSGAVPSLITGLQSSSEMLRTSCAKTLSLAADPTAQAAIAQIALDADHGQPERIAAFSDLAESARRNGNLLGDSELVARLIAFTLGESDLILRAAASQALGALNLPSNRASEIIRAQFNG